MDLLGSLTEWAAPANTVLLALLVWLMERLDRRIHRVEDWIMRRANGGTSEEAI